MEKSHTLDELELNEAVDFIVSKISKFTNNEIAKMAFKNNQPRCVAINNAHYRVGKQTIKRVDEFCWRVSDDTFSHDFMYKKSAIFYSLCQQFGKYDLAFRILDSDQKLADHTSDFTLFQLRSKSAVKGKDTWKSQLYLSRKKQAHSKCLVARTQLQKSLRLAAHYKLWKPI